MDYMDLAVHCPNKAVKLNHPLPLFQGANVEMEAVAVIGTIEDVE